MISLMLTPRTIIGIVVGSAIIGIGVFSLVSGIGFQTIDINETFGVGESTTFQITANKGAVQHLEITGERFDIKLSSPEDGLRIPEEGSSPVSFKEKKILEWTHLADGITNIKIQNLGATEMQIDAVFNVTSDPILFTYHFMVIISGMVIIGFSMGFTLRKPKGF